MAPASFNDLRVLALESRHAKEIAKLIASYGGRPTVAPAVREVSIHSPEALAFAQGLYLSRLVAALDCRPGQGAVGRTGSALSARQALRPDRTALSRQPQPLPRHETDDHRHHSAVTLPAPTEGRKRYLAPDTPSSAPERPSPAGPALLALMLLAVAVARRRDQ